MQKKYIVLGLLALIAVGFSYYQFARPAEAFPLTITVAKGGIGEMRALIMKKYGFDKKHGLDIAFVADTPSSIEQNVALRKGISGIADVSPLSAFRAQAGKNRVDIIAPFISMAYSIAVRHDSPIEALTDLKGKRMGVLPKITAPFLSITIIFHSAGIDLDEDLKLSYGAIPDMVSLLQKGDVDAATVGYPTAAGLYASGQFRSIADLEDIWEKSENGLTNPFVVTVAYHDWLEDADNRELARRYRAASLETSAFIKANPETVTDADNAPLQQFLKDNGLTSPKAQELLREHMGKFLYTEWGEKEVAALERILVRAKELNLVSPSANLDIVIKPSEL